MMELAGMRFVHWYFLLLIPLIIYVFLKKRKQLSLKFSNVNLLKNQSNVDKFKHKIGKYLILLSTIIFIVALARPQIPSNKPVTDEGIDIALLLDVSGSMESVDFNPNRLEVAKNTIIQFVKNRFTDRMALIAFAGNAYTRIPLTLDYELLIQSIESIDVSSVNEEGTAIGMAISVGVNRLKKSDASSKIMILVTDGDNNVGAIDPITATELAEKLGIKIYTIGVGTDKTILPVNIFGVTKYQQVEGGLNEELLQEIANTTGGAYFRAKDSETLSNIFSEINKLEKSKIEHDSFTQYNELGFNLIKIGLILLIIGIFLESLYYIKIP